MIRDELKTKDYFDEKISKLKQYIREDIDEIKAGKIKKDRIYDVSNGNFAFSLKVTVAMYSRGDEKAKVLENFLETIDLMHAAWSPWPKNFEGEFGAADIQDMLMMLSLAIVLDAPADKVSVLIKLVDIVSKRYKLLDYYLSYFDPDIKIGKEQKVERAYKALNGMADVSNEDILSKNLMGKYLKSWYKDADRVYLHDSHDNDLGNYAGYWSFESAAFVKIRGLDDSSFSDESPFYPKDLV